MLDKIKSKSETIFSEVVSNRRHLHANPELSLKEYETSKFVQGKLSECGISFKTGIAETGVVATVEGNEPSSKTIALRADMDALPITEANDVAYKSKNVGVMHACGHDVHTASLLGTAKILNDLRNEFSGTVRLIFQPSEEKMPGGANLMIQEGVLKNPIPSSIFGQHVHPPLEAGKFGFCGGQYMASADEVHIRVVGKGGHGALPQDVIDPILIASHIIVALQQVVSRKALPSVPTVLSIGKVIANGATNIIPDEVKIEGTFRSMDETWRQQAHDIIEQTAQGIAQSFGGRCEVNIPQGYPSLFNNEALTTFAKKSAIDYFGNENVVDLNPRMTGEDFAFYTHHVDGCFYRMGTGNVSKGITSPVHTPTFNIDEDALKYSPGFMAWLALEQLAF